MADPEVPALREPVQKLGPDQLEELWALVEKGELTEEELEEQRQSLIGRYAATWTQAMILYGESRLRESLVRELALYFGIPDAAEIRHRCREAVITVRDEWRARVLTRDRMSVEAFYEKSEAYIYDLMWWHTLADDPSPLAYVIALDFAGEHRCRSYLDFGSGVGSGAILFARHGLDATMADISSPLLAFSQWRFDLRGLKGRALDTKADELPTEGFDLVTAMDTFEHLADPVGTVEVLWKCLRPGGFLVGRFHAEADENYPQHIVQDFAPTFGRMESLGFVEVWRDEWLWGHQVFQKR